MPVPQELFESKEVAHFRHLAKLDPDELYQAARQRVYGQDAFLRRFATVLCMQIDLRLQILAGANPDDLPARSGICVMGPTASGKTYSAKKMLDASGLHYDLIDTPSITGSGWRGKELGEALESVAKWQGANPGQLSVVLWDEFDKIGLHANDHEQSFNPQKELLVFLDSEDAYKGDRGTVVNPALLINVFLGAFEGIEDIVKERLRTSDGVGFVGGANSERAANAFDRRSAGDNPYSQASLRAQVVADDLKQWGFMPELCGRIHHVLDLPPLDKTALRAIAKDGRHNLEGKYANLLATKGISFGIDDDACDALVDAAYANKLGARGLSQALSNLVLDAQAHAREQKAGAICVVLDKDGRAAFKVWGRPSVVAQESAADELARKAAAGGRTLAAGDESAVDTDRAKATCSAIDSSVGDFNFYNWFKSRESLNLVADHFAQMYPHSVFEFDLPLQARRVEKVVLMALMFHVVRYGQEYQTLGNLWRTVELMVVHDDCATTPFDAILRTALKEHVGAEYWYLEIKDAYDKFRTASTAEQNGAVLITQTYLQRCIGDRRYALGLMEAFTQIAREHGNGVMAVAQAPLPDSSAGVQAAWATDPFAPQDQ